MVVYGGYVPEKANYMTSIYAFDFEKKTWEVYFEGGKAEEPEARSDFDMVVHDGCIWMFGGSNGKKTLNDLWKYQPKEGKWSKVENDEGPEVKFLNI